MDSPCFGKRRSLPFILVFICTALLLVNHGISGNGQERTLRIGTPDRVKSANILLDSNLAMFAQLSNPPLIKMDDEHRFIGQLIERFEVSADFTIWTFIPRKDLWWSDGQPVTPEDIRFTIEYTRDKSPAAGWMKQMIRNVHISNDGAVVVHLNQPYSRLEVEFATHRILPKHVWQNVGDPMKYTNPEVNIGCGPFYISRIDLNRGVILYEKNHYWRGRQPHLERIEIHLYQNRDVLSLALEKGEVDTYFSYAASYPYSALHRLRSTGRFHFIEFLNLGFPFLGLNLGKRPMSDLKFREALTYAIDYTELIKLDALGYGELPNRGFLPPNVRYRKDTPILEHNPEKSKEILELAGYKDKNKNGIREDREGKDFNLTLLAEPEQARIAELIKDYLHQVGVATSLKMVDLSTWINLKDRFRYDLIIAGTSPWGMQMHAGLATGYFDARRTGEGVLHNIADPDFLRLCDNLLSTRDDKELEAYAHALQEYYAGRLPAIPLYWNMIVTPFAKKFLGWITNPLYGIFTIDNFLSLEPAGQ
ncbi:MAG: ABC transporter substrate-binding protein [Candidatus Aminicenantes bacterium]|nr:ABC transporter substrate-binding protein [Candidatus Aminicenantes bacterium]